jgi:branched-chain amino acid transport system permease protein
MEEFLTFTIIGLVTGALYAVAASGLVVTFTTSGIFNFAHGAIGMFAAFTYWQMRVAWHWPAPVALIAVLLVLAPAFGALVERVIMRGLQNVSEVTKLVVSVSLLFGVFQGAIILFPPTESRRLPGFYAGNTFDLGFINLAWHDAATILAAIVTAIVLRFLLYSTRTGLAMRGVVDDRELTQLNGARPDRSSMLSWALGTSLAALAGILLAGSQGVLGHVPLTLLVINAYAAAMFGRLESLSRTFVGAVVLGLLQSYGIGYLSLNTSLRSVFTLDIDPPLSLSGIRPAIPIIALFLVLLFLPRQRVVAAGLRKSREIIPAPSMVRWLIGAVALGMISFGYATWYPGVRTFQMGQGLALGIIMLSLVPLIGWAGQISLAPMAFAGIGAVVMSHWGGEGTLEGLVAATLIPGAVGALVALPALRLRGLYLALSTASFAVFMDLVFFNQTLFLPNGNVQVPRLDLFGFSFDDERAHLVLLGVVFGLVAAGLAWLRHQEFGRRLLAMKSSDAACVTLGVNLTVTKLQVFILSASIAGFGGALYGAQLRSVSPPTFQFLQSLPVVLLAVVGGIAAVGGALFGGIAYALTFLIIPDVYPRLKDLLTIGPALAGISLGRNPNGAVNEIVRSIREARARRRRPETAAVDDDLGHIGLAGFAPADRAHFDAELGLSKEPSYARLAALSAALRRHGHGAA